LDASEVKTPKRKKKKHWLKNKSAYTLSAFALILICFLAYYHLNTPNQTVFAPTNKAAIVDHLSISQPNQTFVENVTAILEQAGYNVSYFKGEDVTVDFYRNLPMQGFSLIILRVHSTATSATDYLPNWVVFFTSEPHSTMKYVIEQMNGELVVVRFAQEGSPEYFGITPLFVKRRMNGNFSNATIIIMGCEGLKDYSMAEAFYEKGAKVYMGWDGPVTADHTDTTTIHLLKHLLLERTTVAKAIFETRKEVGPDPKFQGQIMFYPILAAPYTIPKPIR
jgi:hypothetical protein